MTQAGLYTPDQIEMARLQSTPGSAAASAAALDKIGSVGSNSNNKKKPPGGFGMGIHAVSSASLLSSSLLSTTLGGGPGDGDESSAQHPLAGWKVGSATLPAGWKLKRHEYANQTVYIYMSPGGDIFKTRRTMLDFMWEDGGYTEKEFAAVIVGGKQRENVLREHYEAKMRGNQNGAEDPDGAQLSSEGEIGMEELDLAEDDEDEKLVEVVVVKLEEGSRKGAASRRIKQEKEPVLPTRRSGRVASKIKRSRLDSNDGGGSDAEDEAAAKKARLDDEDILSGRRRSTTQRGGRQLCKTETAADHLTMKEETDGGLKSDVAKDEEETIVPELKEATEDEGTLVAEEEEEEEMAEAGRRREEAYSGMEVTEGGGGDVMYFADSIQYLKEEVQDERMEEREDGNVPLEAAAIGEPELNHAAVKIEQERPSIVRVSSSSVERSAYNVVVNVLSDLVSTISD